MCNILYTIHSSFKEKEKMRKITKVSVLLAAIMMLFASCTTMNTTAPVVEGLAPTTDTTPVKKTTVAPASPYDAIHYGLFNDQKSESTEYPGLDGKSVAAITEGTYSIYIPENGQPKIPTVIVLTPNGITSREFAETETGKWWIAESASQGRFAVVFAEPQNGEWNTTLDPEKRNEAAFIKDIFKTIRVKALTDNAYINCDKNSVSLVGYAEGAEMAAYVAATYPTLFSSTTLVSPKAFDRAQAENLLAQKAYVHNDNWVDGYGNLLNGEVGMPMYVITKDGDKAAAEAIVDTWTTVNTNALAKAADTVKDVELYSATLFSDLSVAEISKLASGNARVQGYAGGTLRFRPDYTDRHWATFEGALEPLGLVRRWRVYTPTSYDAANPVPLVVVMHGSTSAITDIAEETRWSDLAEQKGFVVMYLQGYLTGKNLPKPGWSIMNTDPKTNADLRFIRDAVAWAKDYRNIDDSRVYLTGHSLGAMMTHTVMASPLNTIFAAYAPIGMFFAPQQIPYVNDTITPVWAMNGEFDMQKPFGEGGAYETGSAWAAYFGIDPEEPEAVSQPGFNAGKFMTETWMNGVVPLVQVTAVMDSPHVYMAEEAQMIWDWFSCFTRNQESGTLRYKDVIVK